MQSEGTLDPRLRRLTRSPAISRAMVGAVASARQRRSGRRHPGRGGLLALLFALVLLGPLALLVGGSVGVVSALSLVQAVTGRGPGTSTGAPPLDARMPQTTTITARDGSVVSQVNDVRFGWRQAIPLSSVSSNMVLATLAAEDRRFFTHGGVDPIGLVRATLQNTGGDGIRSGASTLDMQLVRDLMLRDERDDQTLSRKIKEALAALALNERYSKAEILETYLNTVYYGNMAYGVEAAARRYFDRRAADLSVSEAAMLAGLPQAPTSYNPKLNPEAAEERRNHVIDLMAVAGFITVEEAEEIKSEPLVVRDPSDVGSRGSHWGNYVEDAVARKFGPEGLYTAGLYVESSLDPRAQRVAEAAVTGAQSVRGLARANNTSVVVIDNATSQVLAMVGSKDFNDPAIAGQVNVALAGRQPGSSIKPLVFLAGFEHGLYPATETMDRQTPFSAPPGQPPYTPANYEDKYYGRVSLRDALGNSLNVPAVKVLKYTGVPAFQDLARRLGITTLDDWDPRWLSLTLGGGEVRLLELTNAYATIAREGRHLPIEPFARVTDARGTLVYAPDPAPVGTQVVDARLAYQLLSVMGDPSSRQVTFGPSSPINLNRPHMVKTGTTDDYRDTWTMGCLPQVCVGVWMGNTDNQPMVKVSSSLTAGKVWVDTINGLISEYGYMPDEFPVPEGVELVRESGRSGARPNAVPHTEVYLPGQRSQQLFLDMDWRRSD